MKIYNLILLIGIVLILVIPAATAFEFDNVAKLEKKQDQKYGTITIWNAFNLPLIRSKLVEYTLLENTDNCLKDCYAEGTVTLYTKDKLFSKLSIYNKFKEKKNINREEIYILVEEKYKADVPDYKTICKPKSWSESPDAEDCGSEIVGWHKEDRTREVWELYKGKQLDEGTYRWRIEGEKEIYEEVDWIATSMGVDLEQWNWWKFYDFCQNITHDLYGTVNNVPYETNFTNGTASAVVQYLFTGNNNTQYAIYYDNLGDFRIADGPCGNLTVAELGNNVRFNTTTASISNPPFIFFETYEWDADGGVPSLPYVDIDAGCSAVIGDEGRIGTQSWNVTDNTGGGNAYLDYDLFDISEGMYNVWWWGYTTTGNGDIPYVSFDNDSFDYDVAVVQHNINALSRLQLQTGITEEITPASFNTWYALNITINATVGSRIVTASAYNDAGTFLGNATNNWRFTGINQWSKIIVATTTGGTGTMIWDQFVLAQDGIQLGFLNQTITSTFGSEEEVPSIKPTITLHYPPDNEKFYESNVTPNCSAYDDETVLNLSLQINSLINFTVYNTTAIQNLSIANEIDFADGDYNWSCQAWDNINNERQSPQRIFGVDSTDPVAILDSPEGTYQVLVYPYNLTINYTASDIHLDSCWFVLDSGANQSLTCGINSSLSVNTGSHTITLWVNDSFGRQSFDTNVFQDDLRFIENNQDFNSTTYETLSESFLLDFTYNSTRYTGVSSNLVYNSTNYAGTQTGTGDTLNSTTTINIPLTPSQSQENKTFYWEVALSNATATDYFNSSIQNQTVDPIIFTICDDTYNVPFINFTLQDENGSIVPGFFDASTTVYSFDFGVNRTLVYSNTTGNTNYAFCFSPPSKSMVIDMDIQYSGTGYPQRRYELAQTLSNISTSKILYLLKTAEGIYSIYQVQTSSGTGLQDVLITAERQIGGVWVLIEQGTTDSAGAVTFWLDPNYDHRITATKTGYITFQGIIRPSSTTYTIIMESTVSDIADSTIFKGWKWTFHPANGRLEKNTIYNFGFNITSNQNNIQECKIEIVNVTNDILSSATGCNLAGGNISVFLNTSNYDKLWGRFSVKANGTYYILDSDAYWTNVESQISDTTLTSFFSRLRTLNEFGDDENRQEFTRIVFIFFILMLFFCALSYSTGWDPANPGGMLLILCPIIWGLSLPGLFTLNNISPFTWFDQYFVALVVSLITLGYMGNNIRRNAT